ncbi:hypothetical protein ACN27G_04975 [Plantactinospora sp. WMMB334]|uniref:hypothetical protein n=1 Tax=Plantactinospora sp. WMMB334 TaxID=3404119 RepID=UPI003B953447
MARSELERASHDFARTIQQVLNGTVCRFARVGAALLSEPIGYTFIGLNVTRTNPIGQPVGLTVDGKKPYAWLNVGFTAWMKDGHLTVYNSFITLSLDEMGDQTIFHYDYEREKDTRDGYTEAHLQIHGQSDKLSALLDAAGRPKTSLERLHFPVGGRRYRPSLEDVIEFLISERLVRSHPVWKEVLDANRDAFHDRQLRAAVGFRPQVAMDELKKLGHL